MSNAEHSPQTSKTVQQPKVHTVTETDLNAPEIEAPVEAGLFAAGMQTSQSSAAALSPNQVMHLQRKIGNRAVVGLLARKTVLAAAPRQQFTIQRQSEDDAERLDSESLNSDIDVPQKAIDSPPILPPSAKTQTHIARKVFDDLPEEKWKGRTRQKGKAELYEAIQKQIQQYNSYESKTAFELQSDAMALQIITDSVNSWVAQFGSSKTHSEYMQTLLRNINTEMDHIKGRLSVLGMVGSQGAAPPPPPLPGGPVADERKDVPPSPPLSVRSGGTPPPPPPPPSPPPSPSPSPLPEPEVEDKGEVEDEVPVSLPIPSSVSSSVLGGPPPPPPPPSSGVSVKDRAAMFNQPAPTPAPTPKPSTPSRHGVVSGHSGEVKGVAPSEMPAGPQIGMLIPSARPGEGTALQRLVKEIYEAWDNDTIPLEAYSEREIETIGVFIETLQASYESIGERNTTPSELRQVTGLIEAIRGGAAGTVRSQLASMGLPVGPDEEKKEDKEDEEKKEEDEAEDKPGGYIGDQIDALLELDADVAAQMQGPAPDKYIAKLQRNIKVQKVGAVAKVAVKTGIGVAASQVPGLGQAFSLVMAVKTVHSTLNHISKIKKIRDEINMRNKPDKIQFLEDVDYLLGKKKAKAVKSGVGGVPGLGTLKTAAYAAKGFVKIVKGTRGVHRKEAADRIIVRAKMGDVHAKMIILELVGKSEYAQTLHAPNGADILAAKFASQ
jgi:hypothetical protein